MGRAFEFRKGRKMKRWSAMAKAFTRIGKDIVMAVKEGGPNPEANSRLRAVIQNAKSANMPKETVERAIKKATDKDTANYKEQLFEGYAPHGIALLIETATDNNNRTVANIRSYFNKCNGTLGTQGSVEFMFDHTCNFRIPNSTIDIEELELEFIDFGAEEIFYDEDGICENGEENAILMAAAPDLLEALQSATDYIERMATRQQRTIDTFAPYVAALRAAIAKAESQ
jgi:YebC/PmpR family DNA-binding regulatory protein